MFQLFNYTTLSTRLEKKTRTLHVGLNRPDRGNAIHQEMLFELESLLAWCTSRVEINTILIDSCTTKFSSGVECDKLAQLTSAQLDKLTARLQRVVLILMQMPQTVIIDLQEGASNWAMELAMGADIRICSVNADLRFNHTRMGLVPAAGAMGWLPHFVSPVFARAWLAHGERIPTEQFSSSGFIQETYDSTTRNEVVERYLHSVCLEAPVQRIQTKLGWFESVRPMFEAAQASDKKIIKASMVSEDWKNYTPTEEDLHFMPAKSLSYAVKLSLIKTDETPTEH